MKRVLITTSAVLMISLFFPCMTGCSEKKPVAVFFPADEIILHPGEELHLEVFGNYDESSGYEPVKLEEGLLFFSSRDELITVSSGGSLRVRPQAVSSGKVLSGESGDIHVRFGDLGASCHVLILEDPGETVDPLGFVLEPQAIDAMVNKDRSLPEGWEPPLLTRVSVPTCLTFQEVNHLRRPAAAALSRLFLAAEEEEGFKLVARSGYRSYNTQNHLYQSNINNHGQEYADKYSARPGTSEHQTGLAMDITSPVMNNQLDDSFGETPEGLWVAANAHRFGFIIRYLKGKEDITGYNYEPWHLRYLGEILAGEIFSRGMVMEEFFDLAMDETSPE